MKEKALAHSVGAEGFKDEADMDTDQLRVKSLERRYPKKGKAMATQEARIGKGPWALVRRCGIKARGVLSTGALPACCQVLQVQLAGTCCDETGVRSESHEASQGQGTHSQQ